jgi:type IV secretory pathway ATPase VirB11/archaellum biosynthesis ATPase
MNSVVEPPIDRIFPLAVDPRRSAQMQDTWRLFSVEMQAEVGQILQAGRSPAEVAYRLGEVVHNFFRTRGLTPTSYELRRLAVELVTPDGPAEACERAAMASFSAPVSPAPAERDVGPIDRLWADRSVDAVFVHGAKAIYVERDGVIQPAAETFRDEDKLHELLDRFARHARAGIAEVRLLDGSRATAVFPPLAPAGPVLALRRADPAAATFDGLVASERISREHADVLAHAAQARLNVLLVGPRRSGKTTFLAAVVRSLGEARIVTVARHRLFNERRDGRVELAAPRDTDAASFGRLIEAGAALRPDHLAIDSLGRDDVPAAAALLAVRSRGAVLAVEAQAPPDELTPSIHMVVSLDQGRGSVATP